MSGNPSFPPPPELDCEPSSASNPSKTASCHPGAVLPPRSFTFRIHRPRPVLNFGGDATGDAEIFKREIDWYKFTTTGGAFTFSAATPNSDMNTVIGIYDSRGYRVGYNNNISKENKDSEVTRTLKAGTYYFGVARHVWTPKGAYTWTIDGTG